MHVMGEIDATNSIQLESAMEEAATGGEAAVVVDCSQVAYISSAGWGVLLAASRGFERLGKRLVLAGMPLELRRVFEMLHFNTVLQSSTDVDSALRMSGTV